MGAHDFGDETVFTKADTEQPEKPKTNPGYNCLTHLVHHGRPEVIWNLPIFQAVMMFGTDGLKKLVLARIEKDAQQLLGNSMAKVVLVTAEERFEGLLEAKMAELIQYYESPHWRADVENVVAWYKDDKLNPNYQPLHGHDSVNLLCRILGQGSLPR